MALFDIGPSGTFFNGRQIGPGVDLGTPSSSFVQNRNSFLGAARGGAPFALAAATGGALLPVSSFLGALNSGGTGVPSGSTGVPSGPTASQGGGQQLGGGLLGGGLLGGLFGTLGANEALKSSIEAQRAAEAASKFTPYNVSTGLANANFSPNGLNVGLSPDAQALQQGYLGAAQSATSGSQNPNDLAAQTLALMRSQAAPYEAQQRADAIAQLAATGTYGLGVGADVNGLGPANPLYSALLKAQSDSDLQRQINSIVMGQNIANQTAQRGLAFGQGAQSLGQQGLLAGQLGGQLGGLQSNAALTAARLAQIPILAQGATKGGLLSGIGGSLGGSSGGMSDILKALGGAGGNLSNLFGNALSGAGGFLGNLFGTTPTSNFGGESLDFGNETPTNFGGSLDFGNEAPLDLGGSFGDTGLFGDVGDLGGLFV